MNTIALIIILFVHLIADFVYQSEEMALNKSDSVYYLTLHVLAYSCFLAGLALCFLGTISANILLIWFAVNASSHWIIDFTTSKITKYFYLKENRYGFFTTIGVDQFLHTSILVATTNELLLNYA